MSSTTITTQPTKQATKPVSRLLALYGQPAPIRTPYPTRQHPDCVHPRREVQCPKCLDWSDLTHNSYCTSCLVRLAYVEVA